MHMGLGEGVSEFCFVWLGFFLFFICFFMMELLPCAEISKLFKSD